MPVRSIRARMTAAFAISLAIIMAAACGGLSWYLRRSAERSADRLLATAAAKLRVELVLTPANVDEAPGLLEEERDIRADGLSLLVVANSGQLIEQTPGPAPDWPLRYDGRWRTTSLQINGQRLIVGFPWYSVDESLRQQARMLASVGLFVVIVSGIGAWALVGRTLNPILKLAEQAGTASVETPHIRLTPSSDDYEVTRLVSTLNGLLARKEELAHSKGRFYAAASHELRTPLQALSGHLELALARNRSGDEYRVALAEARQQTARLTRLVQDLLFLSRVESQPDGHALARINVGDVCERAAGSFAVQAAERGLTIGMDIADDVCLCAPATHVQVLIRNLVENAVKYANAGSVIGLSALRFCGDPQIALSNACGPIDAYALERLFEPFFRPDESRSTDTGGNGLGLAICKAICDAHGWHITLDHQAGCLCVTVRFAQ
jgi:signal transduction histidine kinase